MTGTDKDPINTTIQMSMNSRNFLILDCPVSVAIVGHDAPIRQRLYT